MKIRYSSQYRIQQCVLLASILLCVKMERKRRKPGGDYCSAFGCHNSRNNSDLSMFSFPKDEERLVCHFMLHLYHKIVVKPTVLATFHTKHKTSMSALQYYTITSCHIPLAFSMCSIKRYLLMIVSISHMIS